MNKRYLSSKTNFVYSIILLPIGVLAPLMYFVGAYLLLVDGLPLFSSDWLFCFGILAVCAPVWILASLVIAELVWIGFQSFRLTPDGMIYGFRNNRCIPWREVSGYVFAPFAVGKLQSFFRLSGKTPTVVIVFENEEAAEAYRPFVKQFGLAPLLMYRFFGAFGKLGLWSAHFWVESMLKDVEVPKIDPPKGLVWFEYDEDLVRIIKQQASKE